MKAGRELDILVAEKVMDWVVDGDIIENADFDEQGRCTFPSGDYLMNKETREPLPNYSTNIADAWQVVEKLGSEFKVEIRSIDDSVENKWTCSFKNKISAKVCRVYTETEPLAICLAALKAVGWDGEAQ